MSPLRARALLVAVLVAVLAGLTVVPAASAAFIRAARATYVNQTDEAIRLEIRHVRWAGDVWEPMTLPARGRLEDLTDDRAALQVRLPGCGDLSIIVQNAVLGPAEVAVTRPRYGGIWDKVLWEDDSESYDRGGLKFRALRHADSDDYEEFTLQLQRCD